MQQCNTAPSLRLQGDDKWKPFDIEADRKDYIGGEGVAFKPMTLNYLPNTDSLFKLLQSM